MNTLYIDCRMGVSGAKLLGALVDILEKPEQFIRRFNEMGFDGFSIDCQTEAERGITGTKILFRREEDEDLYDDEIDEEEEKKSKKNKKYHQHLKPNFRTLAEVTAIIDDLPLSGKVRKQAITIYENIAAAAAKIRHKNVDEVLLKRTGSRDVIASVVGVCMIIDELKYDSIIVSTIATGKGYAYTSRGKLPIPVPALQHLLDGVPYSAGTEEGEICTYEGAAILKSIADEFADMPEMTIIRSGAGFGESTFETGVNCVRVYVGTIVETAANAALTELQTVLYDETSQAFSLAAKRLEKLGVTEAYTIPVTSLKGERGYILKCLCANNIADTAAGEILRSTSATKVQRMNVAVYEPQTTVSVVDTSIGSVTVVKTFGFGVNEKKPVAADVIKVANEHNMSYGEAYEIIIKEI